MNLEEKIKLSKKILKAAIDRFMPNIAVIWDHEDALPVILGMINTLYESVPVPLIFIDNSVNSHKRHEFMKILKNKWDLNIIKTKVLEDCIEKNGFRALIFGSTEESEGKGKYVSKKGVHWEIKPVLHWSENDFSDYSKLKNIPQFSRIKSQHEDEKFLKDQEKVKARLKALGYL